MKNDQLERLEAVALDELKEAVWLWVSADSSDRLFSLYVSAKVTSPSIAIFGAGKSKLLISALDADSEHDIETSVYGPDITLEQRLTEELKAFGWPPKIFLNFSISGDPKVDTLGHGQFLKMNKMLNRLYDEQGLSEPVLESAEERFYSLIERRSPTQIERMEIAAARALNILKHCFERVTPGMTEREIYISIQQYMSETSDAFCKENAISIEDYSWNSAFCPIVLVGPNLAKGGHAETTDFSIEPGHTIYADFGVKLTFDDGVTVSSDLQRMAYLPKSDEVEPPLDVQTVFNTLVAAISAGIESAKPGVKGCDIDEIVRTKIVDAGYPSYDHSTGHPIGEVAHSPGTLLAPAENPRGQKLLKDQGTYTIEPRIQIPNGGSIEEMVLVTPTGGRTLCEQQTVLWIAGKTA
jgi:Xaa-Pro aminopeptidase